jgi:hypothetical protein
MKSLRLAPLVLLCAVLCAAVGAPLSQALGPVLISGVQVKGVGSASSSLEAVEIRNYSDNDVDVSSWCVAYASYTSATLPTGGSCISPYESGDKVFIKKQSAIIFATPEFTTNLQTTSPTFVPDMVLSSGLGNTTGQLYLLDSTKQMMNNIKWYTSTSVIAGQINLRPASGQPENISFSRISLGEDGSSGFAASPLPLSFSGGGLYDLVDVCKNITGFQDAIPADYTELDGNCHPNDACANIDGIQSIVPSGLFLVGENCVADECPNIDDVQLLLPDNYMKDDGGNCREDTCTNMEGLQVDVPTGYYVESGECLKYEDRALMVNELLPNASGSDTGLEYIELYNPFDEAVSLRGYVLRVGKILEKSYAFTDDQEIASHEYMVITSAQLPFTLLNTTSSVQLVTPAGSELGVITYSDPQDDMSWSLIDGVWQYTNQRTPGALNQSSILTEEVSEEREVLGVNTLASCGPGKYRHPLTNRCRNIESDVVTLAGCDADEYRNPETNRCRKITSLTSSLAPCSEGQERNLDTNRCRSTLANSSTLAVCQEGYERNPETNRCRKVVSAIAGASNAELLQNPASSQTLQSPYMLGAGVAVLALGYGFYEWRAEILRIFKRFIPFSK